MFIKLQERRKFPASSRLMLSIGIKKTYIFLILSQADVQANKLVTLKNKELSDIFIMLTRVASTLCGTF